MFIDRAIEASNSQEIKPPRDTIHRLSDGSIDYGYYHKRALLQRSHAFINLFRALFAAASKPLNR